MPKLTPMMQQYIDIKEKYKDCLLFFRLGDFYEMFFEDAEIASQELEITLTGRDCGMQERAPMCGVPHHSAQSYIARLINKGYKVAICEQVEDASEAKGIVRRKVTKLITPGTVTDIELLEEKKNNYLMCIFQDKIFYGISVVDVTTGDFYATQITWGSSPDKLTDEISKFSPSEILVNSEMGQEKEFLKQITEKFNTYISVLKDEYFIAKDNLSKQYYNILDNNELKQLKFAFYSSRALLNYVLETQKIDLVHIENISIYSIEQYMILDSASRRNLELTETLRERKKKGSLLWVLDRTRTAMGGRKLRKWLDSPLLDIREINLRLNGVEELKNEFMLRSEFQENLRYIYDIERLAGKLALGNINARDLISLKNSIAKVPTIKDILNCCKTEIIKCCLENVDLLLDVYELIDKAIKEEPPLSVKEGGIIKEGYNLQVDEYRKASREGRNWIAQLEAKERQRTGIKNLKIRYNRVFGYYIEVTKSNISQVPKHYIRKQTLANSERYIIEELKKLEDTILGAEEKVVRLEYEIFNEVRKKVAKEVYRIKKTADNLACLDALASLAEVAEKENYVRPEIDNSGVIDIKEGRHPVIERMLGRGSFVPNSVYLDYEDNRIAIITGPNMAGKSTYMRQVALMLIMAQMGGFVPATSAKIGIADRIFTRVGASDDLASGQSTFMVEMSEVANILHNATPKSLLILDEIGRGTSTYDGLSIAWAVIEYINDKSHLGCRTLFATHYHELTELEDKFHGIKNYCITAKKKGEDIIFLRKIVRGGADESYGIEVARLAGVPQLVIDRARLILSKLDEADIARRGKKKKTSKPIDGQIDMLTVQVLSKNEREVLNELKTIDPTTLTPLEALNKLYALQQKLK